MIADMTMPAVELVYRVGLATLLGVAIGVERQWRARMAGLQTMALVSMGSALFLILGAGVIMKQGSSVTGLNTAATLWATAAVGALCGAWMWREAIAGAAIIIAGNTFLHPLGVRMDHARSKYGREIPPADYVFEVECAAGAQARIRAVVIAALSTLQLTSLRATGTTTGEVLLHAELSAATRDDALLEDAVRALSVDSDVRSVRWATVGEAGVRFG
jgi:putative Mg2+ transporter-C (MgtC) family protein